MSEEDLTKDQTSSSGLITVETTKDGITTPTVPFLLDGSNLAIDIKGGNGAPGTPVIAWGHHGNANQRWRLVNC